MLNAILLAAGKSKRFGKKNKLYLPLLGKPILEWSLELLRKHSLIKEVIVVEKRNGGKTRQESVFRALQKMKKQKQKPEFLLIHNAANPFVTEDEIFRCLYFLQKHRTIDGVGVGRPIKETVKFITRQAHDDMVGFVQKTLDRNFIFVTETPQVVRFQSFLEAHEKARKAKFAATDDLTLLEWCGKKTVVIEASPNNFKITYPRDYELAKILVGDIPENIRVGMAEDTHIFSGGNRLVSPTSSPRFASDSPPFPFRRLRLGAHETQALSTSHSSKQRGLRLAGLLFPQYPKLEANSDGDVILHALASAISQALGRGSLGTFADPLCKKGIRDSRVYLEKILKEMKKQKFSLQHVGLHLRGHEPKIDPIAPQLKSLLAALLKISKEKIGITAETGEQAERKRGQFEMIRKLRCLATVTLVSSPAH